jgi:hypothetical protein
MTRLLALMIASAGALAACGHPPTPSSSRIAASDAIVRIRSAVADAGLWIDGRFIGAVGDLRGGVALEPGTHRLELRHEAYFVDYEELSLTPGQRLTLTIELSPILP